MTPSDRRSARHCALLVPGVVVAKVRDLSSYHTGPDEVGKVAARAGVQVLVLSHLMPGSDPADVTARAARHFAGQVIVGEDMLGV